jgi:DNA-binding transcriptional LysR family regulator
VEMKKGVAIVPRMCVEGELARGDLREVRIRQMRVERKLYLVYRQDRPLTGAAQALVNIILASKNARTKGKGALSDG